MLKCSQEGKKGERESGRCNRSSHRTSAVLVEVVVRERERLRLIRGCACELSVNGIEHISERLAFTG